MNEEPPVILEPWEVALKKFIEDNAQLERAHAGMAARRAHLLEVTGRPDLTAVTPEELAHYESIYGPIG